MLLTGSTVFTEGSTVNFPARIDWPDLSSEGINSFCPVIYSWTKESTLASTWDYPNLLTSFNRFPVLSQSESRTHQTHAWLHRSASWLAKQNYPSGLAQALPACLAQTAMPGATWLCHVIGQKLGDVTEMSQWCHHGLQPAAGVQLESHSKEQLTCLMFDNAKTPATERRERRGQEES